MKASAAAAASPDVGGPRATPARYIRVETAISVGVNLVLAAIFTALLFPGGAVRLWGIGGMAQDFIPATFLPVLGMTFALTLLTRRRRAAGAVQELAPSRLAVPRHPLLRGLLFGVLTTLLLGGAGLALLAALWPLPTTALILFKLAYGAAIGLVATPFVLACALRDPLAAADRAAGAARKDTP